tara:strand:- start:3513 stop:4655 length:1143 start_codon:yes stop_codon:yes gene_type:complete
MKILHIVAGAWESTGGPAEVIPNLCKALYEQGHDVTLLTVDGKHSNAVLEAKESGVRLISFPSDTFKFCRYTTGTYSYLMKNISSFDLVHNHGHWLYPNWLAYFFCKKFSIKLITTPHGTLVPGMLKHKKLKKFISWHCFDKKIIQQSDVIHCLSEEEAKLTSLKVGVKNRHKIKILPNAADKLSFNIETDKTEVNNPANSEVYTILFMSRVSEIKGVRDLLAVWTAMEIPKNWKLQIIGAWDADLEYEKLKANSYSNIEVLGPIYGYKRFHNLRQADAFILPSYGEGLPTALLEASASGKVILFSKECNFNLLEDSDGGIIFNAGEKGVREALNKLMAMSYSECGRLSNNAYELAIKKFSWPYIGQEWSKIYDRVLIKK